MTIVLPLELSAAMKGGLHLRQFVKSHGVGFADGITAAIALQYGRTLVTLNSKHFPMLTDVFVPYTKP